MRLQNRTISRTRQRSGTSFGGELYAEGGPGQASGFPGNGMLWGWGSRMLCIFRIIRSGVGDCANYVTIANAERGSVANLFL